MRLFTAVYLSAQACDHLDRALASIGGAAIADPNSVLRWVSGEQRHITLAFHGEVPDGAVPGYVEELTHRLADLPAFDVALGGGGSFGGRTLWTGVAHGVEALREVTQAATQAADIMGLRADDRTGGRPHLTIARASAARSAGQRAPSVGARRDTGRGSRRGARDSAHQRGGARDAGGTPLADWAHALAVYRGPAWSVREVRVVESVLGSGRSGGPMHFSAATIPLTGDDSYTGRHVA
jgi:2'-5' RNA ligase